MAYIGPSVNIANWIRGGIDWAASTAYVVGTRLIASGRLYTVTVAGTSGTTAPTHTSGTAVNGTCTLSYEGSGTASYSAQTVTIPPTAVTLPTGTIVKSANYSDDIRDFLVSLLDAVAKTYAALPQPAATDTDTKIPSNFSVYKGYVNNKVQFVVSVTTNGDLDFPTLG